MISVLKVLSPVISFSRLNDLTNVTPLVLLRSSCIVDKDLQDALERKRARACGCAVLVVFLLAGIVLVPHMANMQPFNRGCASPRAPAYGCSKLSYITPPPRFGGCDAVGEVRGLITATS